MDIIYDYPYTYTSNEILIHPLDEKPRSVVLYVDSFLAIFSSILMYHESEDKKKCDSINTYTTYSTKKSDYCSLDAELGDFDSVLG